MFSKRDRYFTNENPLSEVIRSGIFDSIVKKGGDNINLDPFLEDRVCTSCDVLYGSVAPDGYFLGHFKGCLILVVTGVNILGTKETNTCLKRISNSSTGRVIDNSRKPISLKTAASVPLDLLVGAEQEKCWLSLFSPGGGGGGEWQMVVQI